MIRKIIHIDEEKCNGCGACANACHEGAIGMVNGKAKLLRDDYCDGLGDCLPACPTNAISFVEREAAEYDRAAVEENMKRKAAQNSMPHHAGCPGAMMRQITPKNDIADFESMKKMQSQLQNWPVQIKLAPINAPYFSGANLLIAADCTAYAYANFHSEFIKGKIVLIGCPKLDYQAKRYKKCYNSKNGSSVLRRIGARRQIGNSGKRQIFAVEGCDNFHRRKNFGLIM